MIGGLFAPDMAVDLGTTNTLVFVKGRGIVLSEPSVVATDTNSGEVVAVGSVAKDMVGRAPDHVVAARPLKGGVIADFGAAEEMLSRFIRAAHAGRRLLPRSLARPPRMVVCVPSGVTGVELRAVKKAAESAGAREAYAVGEPLAAAVGAGLALDEPEGCMVVDVGGGTTEVAVISLGGVVTEASVRVAGDDIDDAIASRVRKAHGLDISSRAAERLKIELGGAPSPKEVHAEIRGRDVATGLLKALVLAGEEIREAVEGPVGAIVAAVRDALERTPPQLVSDVMCRGMVLTGGGALLGGLDERLQRETGVPVRVADEPLACVAVGGGRLLEKPCPQGGVLRLD